MNRLRLFFILMILPLSLQARHVFFGIIAQRGDIKVFSEGKWLSIDEHNYYSYDPEARKTTFFQLYAHDSISLGKDGYVVLMDNLQQKYVEIEGEAKFEMSHLHKDVKHQFKKKSEVHATEWFFPIVETMFDTVNFESIKSKLECKRCITTYNIISPPTGVLIEKDYGDVTFRWKPYPGAESYKFFMNDFFGDRLIEKSTSDSSITINTKEMYNEEDENQHFWGAEPNNYEEGDLNFNSIIIAPDEKVSEIKTEFASHKLDTAKSTFDKFLLATIYYKNGFYFNSAKLFKTVLDEAPNVFTYEMLLIHNLLLTGEINKIKAHRMITDFHKMVSE